jgi:hypothetical protein
LCGGVDKQKESIPMSRRQLKTDDEAGFLMAFCDDIRETELLYGVKIEVRLVPGRTRGQVNIDCEAWKRHQDGGSERVAEFKGQYPTASAARLHAALYRAAIGIGAQCGRAGLPYKHGDGTPPVEQPTQEE